MVKRKYARPIMWRETINNFKIKQIKMTQDLKAIKPNAKSIPLTKIIHLASTHPIYVDNTDLVKLSKRKIKTI